MPRAGARVGAFGRLMLLGWLELPPLKGPGRRRRPSLLDPRRNTAPATGRPRSCRSLGVDIRHQCALVSAFDTMSRRSTPDLLQGTLDLLILRTLRAEPPMHGWAISERIQQISEDVLQVNQGSLYPALPSTRAPGLDRRRMARLGAGSPGQVLQAHRFRPAAACARG